MIDIDNFENIRPYHDPEVNHVLKGLTDHQIFPVLSNKVFPGLSKNEILQAISQVNSLNDFQARIIYPILKKITSDSTVSITNTGIRSIKPDKAYLFISNHHDILMDPSILNMFLHEHGVNTTQVAIGDNLLQVDWIRALARLNKSFIVHRTPAMRDALRYTHQLSNYIYHVLVDKKESVWIAQREGRAKDGNDITQVSLLKMLAFKEPENKIEYLRGLNFLPIAMSYEYDPCDTLKIRELIAKEQNKSYKKSENEDLVSMATGLTGKKGRVHISIGKLIDKEFDEIMMHETSKEQFIKLAAYIDEQIQSIIKLWPNNYIAYDMLTNREDYAGHYTLDEKTEFKDYINTRLDESQLHGQDARIKLLTLYANRVKNKIRLTEY